MDALIRVSYRDSTKQTIYSNDYKTRVKELRASASTTKIEVFELKETHEQRSHWETTLTSPKE